jgi:SAM-dependent methyltransferase
MHPDVQDLRNFYYRSALGRAAQGVIRGELRKLWPDTTGQTVLGYGFAAPLLRPFLGEARRVIGLMPGPQGVMAWPAGQANVSVLCEEMLWPVPNTSIDRLVMLHGLETCEHPPALLDEALRVLASGGRAVFIVPNRGGLWARSDRTPFGFGRPYTASQLESQLKMIGFAVERSFSTLYQPPSEARIWRRFAGVMESGGRHLPLLRAGGVLMVEAIRQIPAPLRGTPVTNRRRLPVLQPMPQPIGRSAREPI